MTFSNTILWLKVILSAATLVFSYLRWRTGAKPELSSRSKLIIGFAVVFSFAVFHNLGTFRGGAFVNYGEMYHYYLGSKYFEELGYYELYNATIVADAEQGNSFASLPFYTDLRTYQNTPRQTALRDVARIKGRFSSQRWEAFKADVAFFKQATSTPEAPSGLMFLLMDHGYNASPMSSFVLGALTNAIPVSQLQLLAAIDVLLVAAMIALVFRSFGFETGAVFAVYFFVNILSGHEYISGSLLRYDWLLYIVAAVCSFDKGRYASAAFFLSLSALLRIFPALLLFGVAVSMVQRARTTRTLDRKSLRFIVSAGVTALTLFLLPAASFGSVLQPWQDFYAKTSLHDSGVYVNHLGLRGMVLFEPSHLSLEKFVAAYKTASSDIVRHWQDVKENELSHKRPLLASCSLFVLACLTAIIWKRNEPESASVLWPVLLVYTTGYLSTYYYAFLCLLVLLFVRQKRFVPLALLLGFNIGALLTDSFKPSPIVFFTLINVYLFLCLAAILGFELYTSVSSTRAAAPVASLASAHEPSRGVGRRRRPKRAHRK
ncbi:MAG TPA: hypothetical protein VJR89_05830 [Polyangiales bacterium]|nr:hypothetical protein [Polyangiales bacterium]